MKLGRLHLKLNFRNKEEPTPVLVAEPVENTGILETFKEHYPLLLPYSYAAIMENEKQDLSYVLLEPTLTDLDKTRFVG